MEKVKLCVIGCGGFSRRSHGASYLRLASKNNRLKLVACCDLNRQTAEKYRMDFGFERAYVDYREMLDKEKPDAICLISPVWKTAELASEIARYGVPLLLEKPPGRMLSEVDKIIAAAPDPNKVCVAFNRRSSPLVVQMRERIRQAAQQGPISSLHLSFLRSGRNDEDFSTTAVHGIDTVRYLLDSDYRRLEFSYQNYSEDKPCSGNIFVCGTMKSGTEVQMQFCPQAGIRVEQIQIIANEQMMQLDIPSSKSRDGLRIWKGDDCPVEVVEESCEELPNYHLLRGYYQENETFVEAVRTGAAMPVPIVSTRQSVEVMACLRDGSLSYQNEYTKEK